MEPINNKVLESKEMDATNFDMHASPSTPGRARPLPPQLPPPCCTAFPTSVHPLPVRVTPVHSHLRTPPSPPDPHLHEPPSPLRRSPSPCRTPPPLSGGPPSPSSRPIVCLPCQSSDPNPKHGNELSRSQKPTLFVDGKLVFPLSSCSIDVSIRCIHVSHRLERNTLRIVAARHLNVPVISRHFVRELPALYHPEFPVPSAFRLLLSSVFFRCSFFPPSPPPTIAARPCAPPRSPSSGGDSEREKINPVVHYTDRISELPDAIILQHIFCCLSMKMAVRTSALSSRWRDRWTSIVNLDFDFEVWNSIPGNKPEDENRMGTKRNEFACIVGQFLERHKGPKVKRFRLYFYPGNKYGRQTVKWLKLVVEKGVEELDLDFYMESGKMFHLPKFVLQCKSLLSLKLTYCNLELHPECERLSSLKIIYLNQVKITDDLVESLLSRCQQLESLYLIDCSKLQHVKMSSPAPRLKIFKAVNNTSVLESIEINAPDLNLLIFSGHHIQFFFKDITSLQSAMLNTIGEKDRRVTIHEDPRLLLSKLSHVKTLHLSAYFFQVVYAGSLIYPDLPTKVELHNLKELQLSIEVMRGPNVTAITYLLVMCPVLEKLFIEVDASQQDYRPTDHWLYELVYSREEVGVFECALDHLKVIEFRGFTAAMWEFALMNALLSSSLILESVVLVYPPDYKMHHILENVLWGLEQKYECTGVEVPPSSVVNLLSIMSRQSSKPNILLLPEAQGRRSVFDL
ncbi:hypothetical protein Taro_008643 [Colocasia esculenta]|uniref:At1g61320/AtMIF1 LRR domain-containing protein n=1 Tax=Colocasia esculenta TaxID=4460 RepID=A0A843U1N3_COLES|nr:hypothetical protein [Colocasia esculenta]